MKFLGSHTREVVFRALWLPGLALLAAPFRGHRLRPTMHELWLHPGPLLGS